MRFELLGKHKHGGKVYERGDIITTELDLDILFKNKFKKLEGGKKKRKLKLKTPPAEASKQKKGKKAEASKEQAGVKGVDKTHLFPLAVKENLQVIARGNWYHIYEDIAGSPLHPKGMKKEAVEPFIQTWLNE